MTTSQPRQPKGQPVGGQFAGKLQTGDQLGSLTNSAKSYQRMAVSAGEVQPGDYVYDPYSDHYWEVEKVRTSPNKYGLTFDITDSFPTGSGLTYDHPSRRVDIQRPIAHGQTQQPTEPTEYVDQWLRAHEIAIGDQVWDQESGEYWLVKDVMEDRFHMQVHIEIDTGDPQDSPPEYLHFDIDRLTDVKRHPQNLNQPQPHPAGTGWDENIPTPF